MTSLEEFQEAGLYLYVTHPIGVENGTGISSIAQSMRYKSFFVYTVGLLIMSENTQETNFGRSRTWR